MSLEGKVCLVTGAARGIGAATAKGLAAQGARLALVGLEPKLMEEVAAACPAETAVFEADTTDQSAVDAAAAKTVEGIASRAKVIAHPGWVRATLPARHLLRRATERDAKDMAMEVERLSAAEIEKRGAAEAFRNQGRSSTGT